MRAVLVVAALSLLRTAPGLAQAPIHDGRAAAPDGTVKITNAAGSVRVVGWSRDSVAVSGRLGAGAERLVFSVDRSETRIRVVLPHDPEGGLGGSDLVVKVPRGSQVAVRTESAGIESSDMAGGLDLETVSGDIRVRSQRAARFIYAQTVAGDVDVDAATKVIRAKSVDGSVTVRKAHGYVELSTVSGAVTLAGVRVWEGQMTTVTGDIRFAGDFDPGGAFYFESHAGDIELFLPPEMPIDLDITSFGERVTNELAPGETSFTTESPGARVRVKSFKGRVRIRKGASG
ncbi:MAG: DUF4097 domain-containing protein [Gemmatimonadota bacterium]